MLKRKLRQIPKFKTYKEEVNFWNNHDLNDYMDFNQRLKIIYPKNLKEKITIRFSIEDLSRLRGVAIKKGVSIATIIRLKMREYLEKQSKLTDN